MRQKRERLRELREQRMTRERGETAEETRTRTILYGTTVFVEKQKSERERGLYVVEGQWSGRE